MILTETANLHVKATLALDIHEERVGRLNKALKLVFSLLQLSWWIKQVDVVLKNLFTSTKKRF